MRPLLPPVRPQAGCGWEGLFLEGNLREPASMNIGGDIRDRRGNRLTVGCLVALVVDRRLEVAEVKAIGPLVARVELQDDGKLARTLTRKPWHLARVEAFLG